MPKVRANGVELNYIREGQGEPVVLAHGYLFGADYWRPQIDALKADYDVIAADFRGQMGSETTEDQADYDLWNQAEDMYDFLQQLGVGPVHWVGLSMGGFIGMRLYLKHPEVIRSFVLMDTQARPEKPENIERYDAMLSIVEAGQLEAVLPALPVTFFCDDFIRDHGDQVEAWQQRLLTVNPMGVVRALRAIDARDDISDRLGEIKVPTLVIHGTEDIAIDMDRAEALAAGIPGARLETVPAGHQSNVDQPELTARLIKDWLATVASAAPAG